MNDVNTIQKEGNNPFILDTGSPHYVKISDNMPKSIFTAGREIRYAEPFKGVGINVNFVVRKEDTIDVCTYERGVEDETYSCGTGVVASALASIVDKNSGTYTITISTKGGQLQVSADKTDHHTYQNIRLIGPAIKVFKGSIAF